MKTLQIQDGVSALHRPLTDMLTSEVIYNCEKCAFCKKRFARI